MSGAIKGVTIERLHYDSHDDSRRLLGNFLETTIRPTPGRLRGRTPYELTVQRMDQRVASAACRICTIECRDPTSSVLSSGLRQPSQDP